MLYELSEFDKVVGEIYKITNTVTNKSYIGQTRSHRLNHKKYRPFGYLGRFKDHVHEAFSNKKNMCRYLNSSIQKHGSESFSCELLVTCKVAELDAIETRYISEYNTKYPNGYNLTDGGKTFSKIKTEQITLIPQPVVKRVGFKKSDETKALMSMRSREAAKNVNLQKFRAESAKNQHLVKKFERFKDVTVDRKNIDNHIFVAENKSLKYEYVHVKINKLTTSFVGKYETISEIKDRARTFIKDLIEWQDTLLLETP